MFCLKSATFNLHTKRKETKMVDASVTKHREEIDPNKHPYPIARIQLKMPQIIFRTAVDEILKLQDEIDLIVALNDKLSSCQTSIPQDAKKEYERVANDLRFLCERLQHRLFTVFTDEGRFSEEWKWVVVFFEYIVTLIRPEVSEKTKFNANVITQRVQWIQYPEKHDEMLEEMRRFRWTGTK